MDSPDRPAPSLAPAPALAVAGLLAAGAALGAGVAGRASMGPDDAGQAILIMALGLAAAWVYRGARARARSSVSLVLALALVVLAGGRAALEHRPAAGAALDSPPGAVHPRRAARVRGVHTVAWDVSGAASAASFESARGALRAGDVVDVLPSADRPRRARSLHRPLRPRPTAARPYADEIVRVLPAAKTTDAARTTVRGPLARLRAAGIERSCAHPDPDTGGLLAALLFGDPTHLQPGIADLFTRTGTRHLLALSGFHIGLLGILFAIPIARVGCALVGLAAALLGVRWRPGPALPTALLALLFVPLSGAGAPAARAAIALALAVLGPVAGRRPSGANLLGVALAIEIALDPRAPLRPGLQLSYLATLALILVAPRAARRALASLPGGGRVEPTWRTGRPRPALARAIAERVLQACAIGVATSVVASAATLPVVWTRFGEWSPVGLVATPLATPLLIVLVAAGWVRAVAPMLVDDALLGTATRALLDGLALADRVPWSPLPLPERPVLALAVGSVLLLVSIAHSHQATGRRALRAAAAVFALLVAPWPGPHLAPGAPSPRPATLEVHLLDVGNGASILVRAPGSRSWLLDAGSRDRIGVAVDGVGPLLRALDVGALDIALSHDHADHARDLPWVARRWPPRRWAGPSATTREASGLGPDPIEGARRIRFERGRTRLTKPDQPLEIWALRGGDLGHNEGSAVFDVRWRDRAGAVRRLVLCGDAEDHGLAAILRGDAEGAWLTPGPVDALLLPHHGSETRHLGRLLDHLRPREAFVSGSAPPSAAAELERRGVPLHTTGVAGALLWRP